ncbi:GNAT family N-acetyltransferase [Carboxylicivirga caseinilyticus]|uniref:GNAT family N-acetyltransferase n=1 Tax=Carboxylicivirga caseinilyticus TaxID=3417572 RepID=UPI003D32C123|nr:GNAT family N-acetyltransferase [Marinilabiliaceae bacterium A049]
MIIKRTTSKDQDFIDLVKLLDADLAKRDGDDHAFFAQYNKIDQINHVVVVIIDDRPVACGAIKPYDENTMEVKRMYTLPEKRGTGLASIVLKELEKWAFESGYEKCILETGIRQPEAIALYTKNDYHLIPNYGQYVDVKDSRCFLKQLQ